MSVLHVVLGLVQFLEPPPLLAVSRKCSLAEHALSLVVFLPSELATQRLKTVRNRGRLDVLDSAQLVANR